MGWLCERGSERIRMMFSGGERVYITLDRVSQGAQVMTADSVDLTYNR